jgi:DegV family protein with EDD domain
VPRAMSPVAVVTDSTHYLPAEMVDAFGLHQVSLYVNWDNRTDRESDLTDLAAYYEHLRTAATLPTTSQPSVGDFLEVYEPLIESGQDIISLHLSGAISGTLRSAEQAREQLIEQGTDPARIAIYDSASAAAGLGMPALAAASRAKAGGSVQECLEAARALRKEMKLWFAVDTLEFLRRGGRIGAAQAWMGSALKIKPILSIESEILPIERVRTSSRAFERMAEYLQSRKDDGCDVFMIQHIGDEERAAQLALRGSEIFGTEPEFVSEIGPVIGTHVGPGLLGVTGIKRRLLYPGG